MLRLVLALAAATAWAGPASSDAGSLPNPMPVEIAWVKDAITFMQAAGPWGFSAFLLYLLKWQRDERNAERTDLQAALKEEQAYNRKVQDDRIASGAASADRLATVAVSSSNAIATAAEKNAGVLAICQEIKEAVQPVDGELSRVLTNQDGLFGAINGLAVKVGNGCRAT